MLAQVLYSWIRSENVASLKAGQRALQEQVAKINTKLENDIDVKVTALSDGHQLEGEKREQIRETVDSLGEQYFKADTLARINHTEINKLKSKIE